MHTHSTRVYTHILHTYTLCFTHTFHSCAHTHTLWSAAFCSPPSSCLTLMSYTWRPTHAFPPPPAWTPAEALQTFIVAINHCSSLHLIFWKLFFATYPWMDSEHSASRFSPEAYFTHHKVRTLWPPVCPLPYTANFLKGTVQGKAWNFDYWCRSDEGYKNHWSPGMWGDRVCGNTS